MSNAQKLSTFPNVVYSGTYTPTLTNITNVASSTANQCQYLRVGNVVTVSGAITAAATANGAISIAFTLPIASNLANASNLAGTSNNGTGGIPGVVWGDPVTDKATLNVQGATTSSATHYFNFTYLVI